MEKLYQNYLDNYNYDERWMKQIEIIVPFPSKSFVTYSYKEFVYKIENDKVFNEMWGGFNNNQNITIISPNLN